MDKHTKSDQANHTHSGYDLLIVLRKKVHKLAHIKS